MGFLDSVVLPESKKRTSSDAFQSAFLNSVILPPVGYQPPAPPEPKPSILSDVKNALFTPPAEKSFENIGVKGVEPVFKDFANTLLDTQDKVTNAVKTAMDTHKSLLDKGVAVSEAGLGAINVLFSPVTMFTNAARGIPGLGYIADGVNNIFAAAGTGVAGVAEKALDSSPFSQETKDKLRPVVTEFGALVGQLILGKAGGGVIGKIGKKTKVIIDTVKGAEAVSGAHPRFLESIIKPKAPTLTERISGVEPAVKTEGVKPTEVKAEAKAVDPVRQAMQPKAPVKTEAPGAKTTTIAGKTMDLDFMHSAEGTKFFQQLSKANQEAFAKFDREMSRKLIPTESMADKSVASGNLPTIEGTGEVKTRGLSRGIEETAVEKRLVDTLGELPQYKTVNMGEQAQKASEIMSKDYEQARRIAMGEEIAPQGIIPEAFLNAVELRAQMKGDVATIRDLALRSRLTGEATTMGQRIRTLGERDPSSPVEAIADIAQAREKAATKRHKNVREAIRGEVEKIKSEIKKKAPSKGDWNDFISKLEC